MLFGLLMNEEDTYTIIGIVKILVQSVRVSIKYRKEINL